MNEWKDGIKLRACDSMNGRIFNNRTHWNIRCKFLEVSLYVGWTRFAKIPTKITRNKREDSLFTFLSVEIRSEMKKTRRMAPAQYNVLCVLQANLRSALNCKMLILPAMLKTFLSIEIKRTKSHLAIERSKVEIRVSLSKLERLRRRITNFFGRFRWNRATPVDI